jgi:hypothetical protein
MTQQRAEWAKDVPAEAAFASADLLTISIRRAKKRGWMVWDAADAENPTAFCSTLADVNDEVQERLAALGRLNNELPFRPQQQQYLPAPQPMQAPPPRTQVYAPQTQPPPMPQEPLPSFMEPKPEEPQLRDKIASVMRNSGRGTTVQAAYLFMAGTVAWQLSRMLGA